MLESVKMEDTMQKRWLTLREAADYLGVSYSTARKASGWPAWRSKGLKVYQPTGKKLMFNIAELDAFIERSRV